MCSRQITNDFLHGLLTMLSISRLSNAGQQCDCWIKRKWLWPIEVISRHGGLKNRLGSVSTETWPHHILNACLEKPALWRSSNILCSYNNKMDQRIFMNVSSPWRMASYGMLRRVALVRTDVSEEHSVSFIRVTRIDELGTTLAVTSNRRTLRRNTKWERKIEWNSEL
jgi:hypothetical protein